MDEGVAAIWAAGIGVGGVVITAAMGFYQARKTAAAQVESALAGAREQIQGQHQAALWQVRRDAYAAFLGQIEAVRMGVAHMFGLCAVAIDILGGAPGQEPDLATARNELTESFQTLWMRESALRLAVDAQEAEHAEHLMRLARRAVDHVGEVAEAIWARQDIAGAQTRLENSVEELRAGVEEWASNARRKLEAGGQAPDVANG
ncbi:hypothetical protein [Streptomyces coelicoflavus]|uniref:hypothetical protein n=1 Tax=Streptomyces coelicoflavus TaxID=285562 RepID=UPI003334A5F3